MSRRPLLVVQQMIEEHSPEHQLGQERENFRSKIQKNEAQIMSEASFEKFCYLKSSQGT